MYAQVINADIANAIIAKLQDLRYRLEEAIAALETTVNAFKSEEVVQSFVVSGKVGSDTENKLDLLLKALNDYRNSTVVPLIEQSVNAIEAYMEMNNSSYIQ